MKRLFEEVLKQVEKASGVVVPMASRLLQAWW